MLIEIVAELDEVVPELFEPVVVTADPFAGFIVTVIGVPSGRPAQLTTTGIGFVCCAVIIASGTESKPPGEAETAIPPTLLTYNCGSCPVVGMIMNCEPCEKVPLMLPVNPTL
jgi:hypothetical protein